MKREGKDESDAHAEDLHDRTRAGGDIQTKGAAIETIVTAAAVVSAAGGMKVLLEMVKLWIEVRKERRIKIKKGEFEMEIEGPISDKEITEKLKHFERLTREEKESEIKILIP